MTRRFRHLLSFAALGLVAASCGSTETSPDATALPEIAEFDASLAAALNNSEDVGALRITSYQAQTLRIEALGVDTVSELDFDNPTTVLESDGVGSAYLVFDLTSQFAAMSAASPAVDDLGRIELAMWSTPDLVVIDTTAYSSIEEANPGQLGVFSPAVFSVDLRRVGDAAGADLATLLVGSSVPDLGRIAAGLLDKLDAPTAQGESGDVFVGTMTFGELLEIQGTSSGDAAATAAAGIAAGLGLNGQTLADFYADFYDTTELDVEVTIGDGDVLESLSYSADLSGLYDEIGDVILDSPNFSGASKSEENEMRDAFADAEFMLDAELVFEPDDSIVVEVPTGDLEDRTDEMVSFFEQSGIDFSN